VGSVSRAIVVSVREGEQAKEAEDMVAEGADHSVTGRSLGETFGDGRATAGAG